MELLKLSKFKLQLQALVTEVRDLRAREHSAQEQLNLSAQKHKQMEEEFMRKLKELQIELADSKEYQQKLERKVSSLESDNNLLESKQKELKETINNLLQSKENFVKVYEDSTCELKQAVLTRDRKCTVLSEKLNSHVSLFEAISKETSSVKQVLETVQTLVTEKERIVAGLRAKMDRVSSFEKAFVDKISDVENKLRDTKFELRKKDKKISELEVQLENAVITNICQPQMEELQTTLSMKDVVIEDLQSEKKVLQSELRSLAIILMKIQLTVASLNEKDRIAYTSALEGKEEHIYDKVKESSLEVCVLSSGEHPEVKENEANRTNDMNHCITESSTGKGSEQNTEAKPAMVADSVCQALDSVAKPEQGNNHSDSSIPVDKNRIMHNHQTIQEEVTNPSKKHSGH